jgi:hypothetical protein
MAAYTRKRVVPIGRWLKAIKVITGWTLAGNIQIKNHFMSFLWIFTQTVLLRTKDKAITNKITKYLIQAWENGGNSLVYLENTPIKAYITAVQSKSRNPLNLLFTISS